MSTALRLPAVWAGAQNESWSQTPPVEDWTSSPLSVHEEGDRTSESPEISLAFYRKRTESLLRRYLYASMQVGRAPSILGNPIARGWVSSRPVRTFEDAIIFVLDVERCLDRLSPLDQALLSKIVLQEYTQVEAAKMLHMSNRAVAYKFPQAVDRLTGKFLESRILILPD